jgi:hypothetical protein
LLKIKINFAWELNVKPETVSNSRQGRGGCGLKRGSRRKNGKGRMKKREKKGGRGNDAR